MVRFQHSRILVLPNPPMVCKAWSAGSMVAQCLGPESFFIGSQSCYTGMYVTLLFLIYETGIQ